MRIKNLFGEYEEVSGGKSPSRITVKKTTQKDKEAPKKILHKVYSQPDKKYFSITEVSNLFGVNSSMLRYWEEKFPKINPSRSSNGARRYTKSDIEAINTVHYFLKVRKWTIEGLKEYMSGKEVENSHEIINRLRKIKSQLVEINKKLESTKD